MTNQNKPFENLVDMVYLHVWTQRSSVFIDILYFELSEDSFEFKPEIKTAEKGPVAAKAFKSSINVYWVNNQFLVWLFVLKSGNQIKWNHEFIMFSWCIFYGFYAARKVQRNSDCLLVNLLTQQDLIPNLTAILRHYQLLGRFSVKIWAEFVHFQC